ncbi:hypothetical protein AB0M39_02415 [Streptomyces sp. NPDC051907]|uniref:hypothetical protein n=1 Tax=Streptomyces sp. NPDC051907 TaxID=3155284 RepID=UPI0034121F6C
MGAVSAAGPEQLKDVSVGDFVANHRSELDRILLAIREIGDFHPTTMAIVDELGWHRDHEVTAPSLLLWSGCIETFSPNLENPAAVHRMVRMGTDLQLTNLMHALIGTASSMKRPVPDSSELIIEAVDASAALLGLHSKRATWDVFRMWRVAFLPSVLSPSSKSPDLVKAYFRECAHTLESLLAER